MCNGGSEKVCKWCGTQLATATAEYCAKCFAPQTGLAKILYIGNFVARNLAIPLAIGLVTLLITHRQQESALIVSNRQKLAEALGEVGKLQADYRLADTQILLMASASGATVPAKDLKDAALRLDVAIASFGAKLGPFEEFARRTEYYKIEPNKPSPLQHAWDRCFVVPYWGDGKKPGHLHAIMNNLAKCGDATCPKEAALELRRIFDEFYLGYCHEGQPVKQLPSVWFNRELRRISIQHPRVGSVYDPEPH